MKRFLTIIAVCLLLFALALCAFAAQESALVAVSYRGDTTDAPPNSLRAIEAAFDAGADWVSVSVQRTKDGAFVLLEEASLASQTDGTDGFAADYDAATVTALHYRNLNGTVSEETVATLEDALAAAAGRGGLILDNVWDDRDALHDLLNTLPSGADVCLRTFESAKKALAWRTETQSNMRVLPVYDGNVVFNAIAHWNYLCGHHQPLAQFQSKNYFNVFYQKFTAKRFHAAASISALAPMYEKDLCGQRSDDVAGWDDLISRGFGAIETSNIRSLAAYIAQCDAAYAQLQTLVRQFEAGEIKHTLGTPLEKAVGTALDVLSDKRASLSCLQSACGDLQNELRQLGPAGENNTQKGSFNLTGGKIAVIVIFGALLLGFDVFVYKKKKKT